MSKKNIFFKNKKNNYKLIINSHTYNIAAVAPKTTTSQRSYNAQKTTKNINNTSTKEIQINKIVAIVNTQVITQQELNAETDRTQKMLQRQGISLPGHIILEKQVLKQMITERLKLQLAKKKLSVMTTYILLQFI